MSEKYFCDFCGIEVRNHLDLFAVMFRSWQEEFSNEEYQACKRCTKKCYSSWKKAVLEIKKEEELKNKEEMTQTFEEFLKQKQFICYDAGSGIEPNQIVISIEDLGEWFWEQLKDTEEIDNYFDWLPSEVNSDITLETINEFADKGDWINLYWEFAIACLGFAEVQKRLRELGKE